MNPSFVSELSKIAKFRPLEEREGVARVNVQRHFGRRAGEHLDLRIGHAREPVAYSWAIPKARFPNEDERLKAIRTFDHADSYMGFSGDIERPWGLEKVVSEKDQRSPITMRKDEVEFELDQLRYALAKEKAMKKLWWLSRKAADKTAAFRDIPRLENERVLMNLQHHIGKRSGEHVDLRLEVPETTKTLSFALPSARFPRGEEKVLAVRTPDHKASYLGYEGKVETPSGIGHTTSEFLDRVPLHSSRPGRIEFSHGGGRYLLHRMRDPKQWLLRSLDEQSR